MVFRANYSSLRYMYDYIVSNAKTYARWQEKILIKFQNIKCLLLKALGLL